MLLEQILAKDARRRKLSPGTPMAVALLQGTDPLEVSLPLESQTWRPARTICKENAKMVILAIIGILQYVDSSSRDLVIKERNVCSFTKSPGGPWPLTLKVTQKLLRNVKREKPGKKLIGLHGELKSNSSRRKRRLKVTNLKGKPRLREPWPRRVW